MLRERFQRAPVFRPELRGNVRTRLVFGLLSPLHGGQAWARPATGQPCAVCEQAIEAPSLEYELKGREATFAHAICYAVWIEESQRLVSA